MHKKPDNVRNKCILLKYIKILTFYAQTVYDPSLFAKQCNLFIAGFGKDLPGLSKNVQELSARIQTFTVQGQISSETSCKKNEKRRTNKKEVSRFNFARVE